ncbi:MAG: hypothetical protein WD431_26250 [Cyclobacteriaceae bacterium]
MKFDYAQENRGYRDTQDKGRAKKLRKASSGKPIFLNGHTLGKCTDAPIFAWIIVHNREQDYLLNWKDWNKKGMLYGLIK